MKRILTLLLALAMTLSLASCGGAPAASAAASAQASVSAPATRSLTDSVGRTVELPSEITKVAVSGPLAQIVLFALCPDELVGVSNAWDETAKQYLDDKYLALPELGQLYGGKGEMNLETLLDSGVQVVIDVGEPKGSVVEDLDALQEQTGVPFVHVTATLSTAGDAYRMLGELLGKPAEAEALAAFCDDTYAAVSGVAASVEKKNVLYLLGDTGTNVIAAGSYHAEIIDLLSNNLAAVDEPSAKGSGNEVDMEQILAWDPDVILFAPGSIYGDVAGDPVWQKLSAVQSGSYYEVPNGPYNWMGFPPSVQRELGLLWMAKLLYPDAADYDLKEKTQEYFNLFCHADLTDEAYAALLANSLGK